MIPVFVFLALIIMYFTTTELGMRTNNYPGNVFQVYVAAFTGIFMIMLLCKKIKKAKLISYLGKYSIITLSIHAPLLHFIGPLVARYIHNGWAQALVAQKNSLKVNTLKRNTL